MSIPIHQIEVGERQRKSMSKDMLRELKESIIENGLINPITVRPITKNRYALIAGERRLAAIREILRDGKTFSHQGAPVKKDTVPATIVPIETESAILKVEFEENKRRENLTWQDECRAISLIHDQLEKENPRQTQAQTAKVIEEVKGEPVHRTQVTNKITLAKNLSDPDVASAKTETAALSIIQSKRRNKFEALRAQRTQSKINLAKATWTLENIKAKDFFGTLDPESVDLILVDPPYGEDVDKMPYIGHDYDDSLAAATQVVQTILQDGWTVAKPQACLFSFCGFPLYRVLSEVATRMGWSVWKRPIIWNKGKPGESPWGHWGFMYTYELLFFAVKGEHGIDGPIPDVLEYGRLHHKQKLHAAEKPIPLLAQLISIGSKQGDLVIDPCAGSASTGEAALRLKRRFAGSEPNEKFFNAGMARLSKVAKEFEDETHND